MFAGEIPFGHRFQCQAYSKCMRTFNITLSYFKSLACISSFWPGSDCGLRCFNWNSNMNSRLLINVRNDFADIHGSVYYCWNDCAAPGEERHHIPSEHFDRATRNYSELYTKIVNFLNPNAVSFEIPPLFCTVSGTILCNRFVYSWPDYFKSSSSSFSC